MAAGRAAATLPVAAGKRGAAKSVAARSGLLGGQRIFGRWDLLLAIAGAAVAVLTSGGSAAPTVAAKAAASPGGASALARIFGGLRAWLGLGRPSLLGFEARSEAQVLRLLAILFGKAP